MKIPTKESSRSKQAFRDYFDLGVRRSLDLLHKCYNDPDLYEKLFYRPCPDVVNLPTLSKRTLEWWSKTFFWQVRVIEEDRRIQAEWERSQGVAIVKMKQRQVDAGMKLQSLGDSVINRYLAKIQAYEDRGEPIPDEVIDRISVNIARFLIEAGYRLESLARGEPTDISAVVEEDDQYTHTLKWLMSKMTERGKIRLLKVIEKCALTELDVLAGEVGGEDKDEEAKRKAIIENYSEPFIAELIRGSKDKAGDVYDPRRAYESKARGDKDKEVSDSPVVDYARDRRKGE